MQSATVEVSSRIRNGYEVLSNMANTPFWHMNRFYPSVEHFYQYWKTTDPEKRAEILQAKSPFEARRIGKTVKVRGNWDEIRDRVMMIALRHKFDQNSTAQWALVKTGVAEIVHPCPWENYSYWGIGKNGGENRLGRMLMELRSQHRSA